MSRSSELTIVLNPEAGGGGRYAEARIEALRATAGSGAAIFVTNNRDLTDAVAEGVRERGVGTVGIIGGDGTVSNVIGALYRAYGTAPLPRIALLRGGTMNTIAMASMNGPEMRFGKNECPVSVDACAWVRCDSTSGPSSFWIGL